MSRDVLIIVRDDLDGSDADETIEFAIRGTTYEIDLSTANVELFDKSVQQFVEVARKIVPEKSLRAGGKTKSASAVPIEKRAALEQRRRIRVWANNKGYKVAVRGSIAQPIIDEYLIEHPAEKLVIEPPHIAEARQVQERLSAQDLAAAGGNVQTLFDRPAKGKPKATKPWAGKRNAVKGGPEKRKRIRVWANDNGYQQAPTGFIRNDVLDAYYEAFPDERED